jgi:acyl-CoA reductase-like NAD-dependent aldehyde dehydrogenase
MTLAPEVAELAHWIGEPWSPEASAWTDITNSATGATIRRAPVASPADVDHVVGRAQRVAADWAASSLAVLFGHDRGQFVSGATAAAR